MNSSAMLRRQKARDAQGKYTVMEHRASSVQLGSANASTEETSQWLNTLPGSDWDVRALPGNPLRHGVEARVRISESTASMYLYTLGRTMEETDAELIYWNEDDLPDGVSFELVQKVRGITMFAPNLMAVTKDGERILVASQADVEEYMEFNPVMLGNDGELEDPHSLNHADNQWLEAIEKSKELTEETAARVRDLIEETGWNVKPYNSRKNSWLVTAGKTTHAGVIVSPGGQMVSSKTQREAGDAELREFFGEQLNDEALSMVKASLQALPAHPTPHMEHGLLREPLLQELHSLTSEPPSEVSEAMQVTAILRGEVPEPTRGKIAATIKSINAKKSETAAAEAKYQKAQAAKEAFDTQALQTASLPPLISQAVREKQESLQSGVDYHGGKLFEARKSLDAAISRWQGVLDRQAAGEKARDAIRAKLSALDEEFERTNHVA